ncbi:hypothetical protein FB446DRAFT_444526 [Lentinula raphanica]|nr:hypothetical protein FB446DRAFT_444526 [Lentinula raphanica]
MTLLVPERYPPFSRSSMSRRLTISSLLCDDNEDNSEPRIIPEPVVLAPHLRRSPQRVESDSTRNSSQPTPSSSSKIGLDALVHAASAVAAAEERSRLPAPSSSSSSSTWSSEGHYPQSPTYTYSPEQLQRHQQQLEQRHVHREQILGYKDHHRTGRKSDPLPGPGMRAILSPTSETAYSSPSTLGSSTTRFPHDADEHLDKKRRYSQEDYTLNIQREHQAREFERLRQQEDADRYRRMEEEQREMQHRRLQQETSDDIRNKITANNPPSRSSIAALTSPTAVSPSLPSRRAGAGYDPVHENDHHPAYNPSHSSSHWDRIQSPSQQFPSSSTHYAQRSGRPMEVIELNEQESEDDRAKRAWNGHVSCALCSVNFTASDRQPRESLQLMPLTIASRKNHFLALMFRPYLQLIVNLIPRRYLPHRNDHSPGLMHLLTFIINMAFLVKSFLLLLRLVPDLRISNMISFTPLIIRMPIMFNTFNENHAVSRLCLRRSLLLPKLLENHHRLRRLIRTHNCRMFLINLGMIPISIE